MDARTWKACSELRLTHCVWLIWRRECHADSPKMVCTVPVFVLCRRTTAIEVINHCVVERERA
ncbi:Uncharacterized protein DAT39_007395 [Clarias magur]|uniref:Uncharacterized protein n=1 Tax=Clarias magur TaxID=1594786 RepID=A0A8J4U8S1_CLAMG|nr:Uncharacterized protein DAT39_007395 [Clarias magur]